VMAPSSRTTLSLAPDLAGRVLDRARRGRKGEQLGDAARGELVTFDKLLAVELWRVQLTLAEAQALADVAAGSAHEPYEVGLVLFGATSDTFRLAREGGKEASYAARFGVDEQVLLNKLLAVGPAADLALRDAISRWWDAGSGDDADSYRAVGINIPNHRSRR
jgi:hypothetical protein